MFWACEESSRAGGGPNRYMRWPGQPSPVYFVSFCPPISYRHHTLSSLLKSFTSYELTNFMGHIAYSLMLKTVSLYMTLFHITIKKISFHKVPR